MQALAAGPTGVVRDVVPREVGVHRAVREDIAYVARDVEQEVVNRLLMERRVLIAGPSMLGKTRLALSPAKATFGGYAFYKPVDGKSVRNLLADGARCRAFWSGWTTSRDSPAAGSATANCRHC
jgi:hypothetical protein